jgi:amidase
MSAPDLDLEDMSIAELRGLLDSGKLTAHVLTASCLARIEEKDARVNAVLELNPEALEIAARLDRSGEAGEDRGPLHGVPILIKDNIDTGDRMTTTAGSLALEDTKASSDAAVAARLRAAGAVILGKTNLSEWANFRSTRSSSGWSSRGGQTRNPHALDRSPGGSSSGSAVAVASGFCPAAIGTETDGSIIAPAAMNGIVGIKPTVGLVGQSGIIPISHSQDTAGPMARTVADAAVVLSAIAEPGERGSEDYTAYLDHDGLKGKRLGVARGLTESHEGLDGILDQSLAALSAAGAEIVDPVEVVAPRAVRSAELLVFLTEFKAGLNIYLSTRGPDTAVRCLADVIAFDRDHCEQVMPYFPQDLFQLAEATAGLDDPAYLAARDTCVHQTRTEGIDKVLTEQRLDGIVAMSTGPTWLIDWVSGDNRSWSTAYLAAISGYPSITVPAGHLFGLPVGLSFTASAFQEPTLIRLASGFEAATRARRPPGFALSAGT